MKEKKGGVALILGVGPSAKKPDFMKEDEDEGGEEDLAIREFVSSVKDGKEDAAVEAFKNVMDIMYAKWMDEKDGGEEEEEEEER